MMFSQLKPPNGSNVKVLNAICGLDKMVSEWCKELCSAIFNGWWKSSKYDECMFYCNIENGRYTILVTYVDGILFAGGYGKQARTMINHVLKRYKGRTSKRGTDGDGQGYQTWSSTVHQGYRHWSSEFLWCAQGFCSTPHGHGSIT